MSIKNDLMSSLKNLNKQQILDTMKEEALQKSLPANKKVAVVEGVGVVAALILGDWSDVALAVVGAIGFNQLVSRSKPLHNIIVQEVVEKVVAVNNIVHDTIEDVILPKKEE